MLAATAVLGATTAFANNPFSDVSSDSWAYQAVSQLAAAGVVNGYPDGTFKGQKEITRFEMAQMIAKAMANQDRANAEQQAMINRLADEFSNELNNLGVRVGRLEDRVGNVKVTGDMRLRYLGAQEKNGHYVTDRTNLDSRDYSQHSLFDARARVQFNAKVNDRTEAVVRMTSGNIEFGDAHTPSGVGAIGLKPGTVIIDRAYVNHKFGERVSAKVGRFQQTFGNGLIYDDTFDGAQFNAGNDKVQFQAAYGYAVEGGYATDEYGERTINRDKNFTITYAGLKGELNKHVALGAFYARYNKEKASSHGYGWTAGLGYGAYNQAKRGTWDVKAQYFNFGENLAAQSSTWQIGYDDTTRYLDNTSTFVTKLRGFKGWLATANYALQDNVGLTAYYGFNNKTNKSTGDNEKLSDYYRVALNYQF